MYRELPGGAVENVYSLKVVNMDKAPHRYLISALNNDDVTFDLAKDLVLPGGEVGEFSLRIRMPAGVGGGVQKLEVELVAEDNPSIRVVTEASMILPVR